MGSRLTDFHHTKLGPQCHSFFFLRTEYLHEFGSSLKDLVVALVCEDLKTRFLDEKRFELILVASHLFMRCLIFLEARNTVESIRLPVVFVNHCQEEFLMMWG